MWVCSDRSTLEESLFESTLDCVHPPLIAAPEAAALRTGWQSAYTEDDYPCDVVVDVTSESLLPGLPKQGPPAVLHHMVHCNPQQLLWQQLF